MNDPDPKDELEAHLKDFPWLGNFGLSPYTTIWCGRAIKWLQSEPEPNEVLHIRQPAGEALTPWLALAIAAWSTRKAHEGITGFENFSRGDKIKIRINNKTIYAKYYEGRANGQLKFMLKSSYGNEEVMTEMRVDPITVMRADFNRTLTSTTSPAVNRALAALRKGESILDELLAMDSSTFGRADLPGRKPVLLMAITRAYVDETLQYIQYRQHPMRALLSLDTGLKAEYDGLEELAQRASFLKDLLGELHRMVIEPLKKKDVITVEVAKALACPVGLNIAGFKERCEDIKQRLEADPTIDDRQRDGFKKRIKGFMNEVDVEPKNMPQDAACVLLNGYNPFLETGGSFVELARIGTRMIMVGSYTQLARELPPEPNVDLTGKAAVLSCMAMNWKDVANIATDDTHEFQDTEVIEALGGRPLKVHLVTLPDGYPTHELAQLRRGLWQLTLEDTHLDALQKAVRDHLEPVMRYLLHAPARISHDALEWIQTKLEETKKIVGGIGGLLFFPGIGERMDALYACIDRTAKAINELPEDQLKVHLIPEGSSVLVYSENEPAHPIEQPTVAALEKHLLEGHEHVALTGWSSNAFLRWLYDREDDHRVERLTIIDDVEQIKRLRYALKYRSSIDRRPGKWDDRFNELLPEEPEARLTMTEEAVSTAMTPDFNTLDGEFDLEDRFLKARVRVTDPKDGTEVDANVLQFEDGSHMPYPEEGSKLFPVLLTDVDRTEVVMKHLSELGMGDRLVWIENMLSRIRSDVNGSLKPSTKKTLYAWRRALESLQEHYNNDLVELAKKLVTTHANVYRWLHDEDLWQPHSGNLNKIMALARSTYSGGAGQDWDVSIPAMDQAKRLAKDQRKRIEKRMAADLSEIIHDEVKEDVFKYRNVEYAYKVLTITDNQRNEFKVPQHHLYQLV